MPLSYNDIIQVIAKTAEIDSTQLSRETPLLGSKSVIDSIQLVSICIALEDVASAHGFTFDWTSEKALSAKTSMFRTIDSLITEFFHQRGESQ